MISRRAFVNIFFASALWPLQAHATPNMKKRKRLMEEHDFWDIVERAKRAAGPLVDRRPDQLEVLLLGLSLETIQAFQRRYEALLLKANRWSLWGAAYIMNDGCSDDGFRYFRDWLISEGRDLFESAVNDPDSLSAVPRLALFDLESFGYAALKAYALKGGGELDRDFQDELARPEGKEWNEAELPRLFPKLAAVYGRQ